MSHTPELFRASKFRLVLLKSGQSAILCGHPEHPEIGSGKCPKSVGFDWTTELSNGITLTEAFINKLDR